MSYTHCATIATTNFGTFLSPPKEKPQPDSHSPFLHPPQPQATTNLSVWIHLFWTFYINGIIHCVVFCDSLLSLSWWFQESSTLYHVIRPPSGQSCSTVQICPISFRHLPDDGLDTQWVVLSNAAMKSVDKCLYGHMFPFLHIPRSHMVTVSLTFWGNNSQSPCTILQFSLSRTRVLFSPHPCPHLAFLCLCPLSLLLFFLYSLFSGYEVVWFWFTFSRCKCYIFSYAGWPLVYLLWRNLYSDLLPILKLDWLSYYWIVRVLHYFQNKSGNRYLIWETFSHSMGCILTFFLFFF